MKRSIRDVAAAFVTAAATLTIAAPARAQMVHVPDSDWRQTDRHDAVVAASKAPLFVFEVRFGLYQPDIDHGLAQKPYATIFGKQCTTADIAANSCSSGSAAPRFHFGFEADVIPVRLPYVGAFGLGVGWGLSQVSAAAKFSVDPNNPGKATGVSGETTSLMIMPMHASFVLRADEMMRRTGIPVVPYGKFGFGLAYWRASTDAGTEVYTKGDGTNVNGAGLTPSLHFAVGGMLALNFLEPRSAARLDETTGVHHAYAFGEYYNETLTLAANVMRVGTSSWVVGLAVDF